MAALEQKAVVLFDASGTEIAVLNGVAIPASTPAILLAGSDGTNARYLKVAADGTVRVDPAGTTTQPVSGTVTANQGTPAVVGNAWPTKVSDGTDTAGISTVGGSKALKVDVIQSVGSSGGTSSSFGAAFPAAGTAAGFSDGTNMQGAKVFDADTGAGTELVLGAVLRKRASGGSVEAGTSTDPLRIDPTGTTTQPVNDAGGSLTVDTPQLPAALVGGRLDENVGAWIGSTAPTVGQKVMASSLPVTMASDQPSISVFIAGPPPGQTQLIRFGRLTTSATGSFFRMEATTYTEPGSAVQRSVSSSSASDTSAGTGARTVEITYYDNTLAGPFTVTLTLNGTTAVNTGVTDIRFIESIKIKTVGSNGSNVGIITLFGSTGGGGGTVGTIAAADNQTFWAHHYIAVSKTASLRTFLNGVRGGNQGGGFHGRKINPLLANDVEIQITDELRVAAGSSSVLRTYDSPITIVGPSKFTVFVFPEGSNTLTWHSSFDMVEA